MTELRNAIDIEASTDRVWSILANLTELSAYDPTVSAVKITSSESSGIGASRRVTMADGKRWFDETVVAFDPGRALTFELTACNFPIDRLNHSYSFERTRHASAVTVTHVMTHTPTFGPLGKLLDIITIRRNSERGITAFFAGLKARAERATDAFHVENAG